MSVQAELSKPEDREAQNPPLKTLTPAAQEDSPLPNGVNQSRQNIPNGLPLNGSTTPDHYEGEGIDESPRSPVRHGHRRIPSLKVNGGTKPVPPSSENTVYEKPLDDDDTKHAMSRKPAGEFEEQLRLGKDERPGARTDLVSGRRAGEGWHKSSIRFAPLNIPLQRRLQTLVVLLHTLTIALFLMVFFFLCAIPILWPILLPYLIFVLFSPAGTDGKLSYRSQKFRGSKIWSLYASYFPARLHRTQELPPTRKYILGYHPHGIISHGAFAAFTTEALGFSQLFPGITNTLLTLDSNFRIPLYREYALRMGLASVSKESCENILTQGGLNNEGMGRAITIVIGGARESLEAKPGYLRLVLNSRKGFVKMAIRTGADLVPVLGFGENELYEQFEANAHPIVHKLQLFIKKVAGFTIPLFHARGVFNYDVGMMPYRRPINVVVGRPIKVMKQENPESSYVDQLHAQYVEELRRVWDEWKDTFVEHRRGELEIIG